MGYKNDLTNLVFGELTVLEQDYNYVKEHNLKQNRSYWKCLCSCGEQVTIKATDLINGKRTKCKNCTNATKIKNLCGQKFNHLTVLEMTNKRTSNRGVIFKCQCECGNIIEVSGRSLQNGDKKHCGCLKGKEKIIDLTGQHFGQLTVIELDTTNKNGGAHWICQCECGNKISALSAHLRDGHIKSCGCLIHKPKRDLTGQVFGKLTVLSQHIDSNPNPGIYWLCKCACGNIKNVAQSSLLSGGTKSCGCLKSAGEYKIIQLLQENNIYFQTQKTFETCRFPDTQNKGYFDFYINNEFLLEYDGPQHFSYHNTGWDNLDYFLNITKKDKFKNQWCRENNIPLKRIPYWKLSTLTIDDILNDTFLLKENR